MTEPADHDDRQLYAMIARNHRAREVAPELVEALREVLDLLPSATTHPVLSKARALLARVEGE